MVFGENGLPIRGSVCVFRLVVINCRLIERKVSKSTKRDRLENSRYGPGTDGRKASEPKRIIGAAFIIFAYAALAVLSRPELVADMSDETRYALLSLFRHLKGYSIYFLLIIMSAGALSYYVLFFKSRFIPRWLSAWGIFTYAAVGLGAVTIILFPAMTRWIMFVFLPGAAFEFVVGFWLLFRGIDMPAWDRIQSETPMKASGEKLTT